MRTLFTLALGAAFLFTMAACGDPLENVTEAETGDAKKIEEVEGVELKFNGDNSKIEWKGSKVVDGKDGGHVGGFKKFDGVAVMNDDKSELKQVRITIDMNSLWTDDDEKDPDEDKLKSHLKSGDFFKVEEFPTAKFITSEIKKGGSDGKSHTVTGNLTMRGNTKSITFPADITINDGKLTAKAEFKIDRKDWGVAFDLGAKDAVLHDDVGITFDIKAE